jgi:septum formation protein
MRPAPRIVLASQSPRRAELLRMLGLQIEAIPADIDESYPAGESAAEHAERLAREKAQAVAAAHPDAVVIGSDTVVVIEGELLGKPRDADDAARMLLRLQGRAHEVITGVAVCYGAAARVRSAVERVTVRFRPFGAATARAYAATGEPLDKAGAYGIQGRGSTLVEGIEGDYFAVMGLPICRLMALLAEVGLTYDFGGLRAEAADGRVARGSGAR